MASGFSFERVSADDYDALRPEYAPEAAAWVAQEAGLDDRTLVVDLAAGTGQLSRRFALLGVPLVAVEPARNMREALSERLPALDVRKGTAEAIPLEDGSAAAVVVGNAFHHFDEARALAEIRRVLRPSGTLALFWAQQSEDRPPALQAIDRAVEEVVEASAFVRAYRRWWVSPQPAEGFTPFERRAFPVPHVVPSARLADLYATSSDVASLPADVRGELLARIGELARDLPETLELPGRSVVDLSRRRD